MKKNNKTGHLTVTQVVIGVIVFLVIIVSGLIVVGELIVAFHSSAEPSSAEPIEGNAVSIQIETDPMLQDAYWKTTDFGFTKKIDWPNCREVRHSTISYVESVDSHGRRSFYEDIIRRPDLDFEGVITVSENLSCFINQIASTTSLCECFEGWHGVEDTRSCCWDEDNSTDNCVSVHFFDGSWVCPYDEIHYQNQVLAKREESK